jgi:hypothetical protein
MRTLDEYLASLPEPRTLFPSTLSDHLFGRLNALKNQWLDYKNQTMVTDDDEFVTHVVSDKRAKELWYRNEPENVAELLRLERLIDLL